MSEPVIRAEGLIHTYPNGVTALNGVDLIVESGEMMAIVGQNGSGKTTMVRHFNGLLRPTEGKVFVKGEDSADLSIAQLSRSVGYVFQNPNHQIFCTTVKEELEVAPKNFGFTAEQTKQAIDSVLEMIDLNDVLGKNPLLLDYTTKKLVTIASVLVWNPEVLILDEPTGGLDEVGRQMLSRVTELLHDSGHTVIMISHDMDYVAEHSKRVVVMCGGNILLDGSPEHVFTRREILKQAQIEPPQITQLDLALRPNTENHALSVADFVNNYHPN